MSAKDLIDSQVMDEEIDAITRLVQPEAVVPPQCYVDAVDPGPYRGWTHEDPGREPDRETDFSSDYSMPVSDTQVRVFKVDQTS